MATEAIQPTAQDGLRRSRSRMTLVVPPKCNMLSRVTAGGSRGAIGQAAGGARRLLALVALCVGRPVCGLDVRRRPCRHGRAWPQLVPRQAAARTSPASARPAGRRTVARLFRACRLRRCARPFGDGRESPAMTPLMAPPATSIVLQIPCPQQPTRYKSAPDFGSYGFLCWSPGWVWVRPPLAVMAGLAPAIHAGPPQERVPPRRDRQEGGRSQGFSRELRRLRRCAGPSEDTRRYGQASAMTP